MDQVFGNVIRSEEGQGLMEYVLIIGLVAIILIATIQVFQGSVTDMYQTMVSVLWG